MIGGIGTDVVNVARIRKAAERWGHRFLSRVFTEEEIAYCRARSDPYPHLAARFAAKEAALKALFALRETGKSGESSSKAAVPAGGQAAASRGEGGSEETERQDPGAARVSFRDVEILNHPTGRPFIRLGGPGTPEGICLHLSISHEQDVAIAVVVLEKSPAETI